MCWCKIRLKKILQWDTLGVDLIFRIVCQISGQDNVLKLQNPKIILAFSDQKFLFLCFNGSKRLLSKYLF